MANEADTGVDWTGVSEDMAREIKSQGERYIEGQLQIALASDQRAATMAGIFTAIATAAIAGGIAYWDKTGSAHVLSAGLAGGFWMMIGVGLCLWAARPVDFYIPGNHPEQWYESRLGNLAENLGGEAENYQTRITSNAARLVKMGRVLKGGAFLVCTAPIVATASFWLTTASSQEATRPASLPPPVYSAPAKAPTPPLTSRPATTSDRSEPATQR